MIIEPTHLVSTQDPISKGIVAVVLLGLFALLTLEKAHRVLIAMTAVSLIWLVTYLTPYHLITFEDSAKALDLNVLLLLASMMALVAVLKSTGAFDWAIARMLRGEGATPTRILMPLAWFTAVASALLDNVTTVIFVTPIAMGLARRLRVSPAALLLPVVMAANIGGTSTLIGDPPNIMIGSGANLTFVDFLINLAPPVLVMMFGLEFIARRWFATDLAAGVAAVADPNASTVMVTDPGLLRQLAVICGFVLIGFLTHGITGMPAAVPATVGAGAALLVQDIRYLKAHHPSHEERVHGILDVLEHQIEWATLVFFAFLFIVVGAAVETGLIGSVARGLEMGISFGQNTLGLGQQGVLLFAAMLILWVSGVASALIDNIPFVAVSIPVIREIIPTLPGDSGVLWWALALGACLGGNGTPVGASANVTTLDLMAREGTRITFAAFTRFGATVAGFTLIVSCIWLTVHVFVGAQETMLGTLGIGLGIAGYRLVRRTS